MISNLFAKINPVAIKIGDFEIRWYALCIVFGALLCFLFIRHKFKKDGFNPDMADTIFLLAFPAGIVGARIWWCISDSGSPWRNGNFWGVFNIRDGGLAIQGGVILGVLVGLAVVIHYKKIPLMYILDLAVPNILLAQAIGRWGNFFNCEVYGRCVPLEELNWLPSFIRNQMQGEGISAINGIACEVTEGAIPLFLIEGILNIIGWALLAIILPKFWKKRKQGDIYPLYFVWYGTVRLILEPLRNEMFIMSGWGNGYFSASVVTSIFFIVLGIALFVLNRAFKLHEKIDNFFHIVPETKEQTTEND